MLQVGASQLTADTMIRQAIDGQTQAVERQTKIMEDEAKRRGQGRPGQVFAGRSGRPQHDEPAAGARRRAPVDGDRLIQTGPRGGNTFTDRLGRAARRRSRRLWSGCACVNRRG